MLRFLPLLVTILTIGFTALVSVPGSPYLIGGHSQADISNMFPSSITPAGITFSIWGVIYIGWLLSSLLVSGLPLTPLTKRYFPKLASEMQYTASQKTSISYALSIGLTAVWLIPWGYIMPGVALIIMLLILWLIWSVFFENRSAPKLFRYSVELFLGWILVATFANLTVWLRSIEFPYGWPEDLYYAIFAIGALLLIVSELQCRYASYVVSGVFLWTMLWEWIAHPILEERVMVVIYSLTLGFYIWNSFHGRCTSLRSLKFW